MVMPDSKPGVPVWRRVSVRVTEADYAYLLTLGDGSMARGLRFLLSSGEAPVTAEEMASRKAVADARQREMNRLAALRQAVTNKGA
jgi:hypothetical protein